MKRFELPRDFEGWVWFLLPLILVACIAVFIGDDAEPPAEDPESPVVSEAFYTFWHSTSKIEFLGPGESWQTPDFTAVISDTTVESLDGASFDLTLSDLYIKDAFLDGTLQVYVCASCEGDVQELLSGKDFLMFALMNDVEDHHGCATFSLPSGTDYLLVVVAADGSIYRATYSPE